MLRESLVDLELQLDKLLVAGNQESDANKHQQNTDDNRKNVHGLSLGLSQRSFSTFATESLAKSALLHSQSRSSSQLETPTPPPTIRLAVRAGVTLIHPRIGSVSFSQKIWQVAGLRVVRRYFTNIRPLSTYAVHYTSPQCVWSIPCLPA